MSRIAKRAIGEAQTVMRGVLKTLFASREDILVSEWSARHRVVILTDQPGPWDNDLTPYLTEVMDSFCEPAVRTITIKKGSQTGGTEAVYNMLFWAIDQRPGLCMFIYPDADSASDQNQVRFIPTLEASPRIAGHLSGRKYDLKSKSIKLDTMTILFRGSFSEHKIESFPTPIVIVDELDRCPPRTGHLAKQRGKTFVEAKTVMVGKPGMAGQGIDEQFQLSDQRQFHLPCPHCLEYHIRTFAMIRWEGLDRDGKASAASRDVTIDPAEAERTAWLECPHCRGRCGPEHHRWQLRLGRWAARGQSVTPARRIGHECIAGAVVGDGPRTDHRGYHISGLISGLRQNPYGEAAREYVARRGRVDADFLADQLGEAYRPSGDRVEASDIRETIRTIDQGGYRLGQVPAGVLAIVAGVDIQASGVAYVEVRGFGERGRDRWLLWYERVPAPEHLGLASLDDVLYRRPWRKADGTAMRIFARFIDSGDRTTEVYDYCRTRHQRGHCFAVKGVGQGRTRMDQPYRWRRIDQYPGSTKPIPGGVRLLRLDSHTWKSETLRRLRVRREEADERDAEAELVTGGDVVSDMGEWHFPVDVSDEYLRQLTAEQCVTSRRGDRTEYQWVLRPGRTDNHYFDCAQYLEVGSHALGIRALVAPEKSAAAAVESPPAADIEERERRTSPMIQRAREQALRKRK